MKCEKQGRKESKRMELYWTQIVERMMMLLTLKSQKEETQGMTGGGEGNDEFGYKVIEFEVMLEN